MFFKKKFKIGNSYVGNKDKVFVIAEIGVNHNGNILLAKRLVDEAAKAGADCVKFQTFTADSLVNRSTPKTPYQIKNTNKKENHYQMLKKLELKKSYYPELLRLCKKKKLVFMSTPYSFDDVNFLHKIKVPAYKFASMHLPETEFINYVAKKNKPMVMSTGMSSIKEISSAVNAIKKTGNKNLVLMQCTTDYPSKLSDANLLVLDYLKKKYQVIVGYSDHTASSTSAIASVALGARVIEKHFTLSKKMRGPDHSSSLEPKELREYIKNIREAELSLGSKFKKPSTAEKKNFKIMRRSIYSNKEIDKGSKIKLSMLEFMRPYDGIPVSDTHRVLNKTTKKKIKAYSKLKWSYFK